MTSEGRLSWHSQLNDGDQGRAVRCDIAHRSYCKGFVVVDRTFLESASGS